MMEIEIAVGVDGAWVVMSHPARTEDTESTIEALFEQHQYDARIGDTFDLSPGIYKAEVVWKCDGDPDDPTNDGHYVEVEPQAAAHGMAQAVEALRGLLLHGQHEGECEYYDDDPDNACRLHVEASRAREAAARQALAALDAKGTE